MRLKEYYEKKVVPEMKKEIGYPNRMAVPRLIKVVVNVGFGRQAKEKAVIDRIAAGLRNITGQKPIMTKAKKSISAFKVREGMVIGAMVTLRGQRMYDFTEKLTKITFARVRDFRGLDPKAVDNKGNLTVGIKEHLSFPEIKAEEVENTYGLEVSIATTAKTRADGLALFTHLGFPFKKE
jgi:large subunit ribosomal protein L5